ncbi:MAG: flagellar basal body rod protein FlgB [Bdellovibrionaceae bacterium]|nr:flagellar basal body rod protein FlgB [Pseudobdellovibrionaceae bacterium]
MSLFDKTSLALQTATNLRKLRQELISSNIANAETPGFHAKKMDFEAALDSAVNGIGGAGGHESAIKNVRPDIYDNPEAITSNDGNTVNIEKEMAALAENTVLYKAAIQLMNKKLAALRYAVTEGR